MTDALDGFTFGLESDGIVMPQPVPVAVLSLVE